MSDKKNFDSQIADFLRTAGDAGLVIKNFKPDGKVHNVQLFKNLTRHRGQRSGSYAFYLNEGSNPGGWVENFADPEIGRVVWKPANARTLSKKDFSAIRQKKQQHEQEIAEKNKAAAKKAYAIWKNAKPAPAGHKYLLKKGIEPVKGVKIDKTSNLIVPYFDNENRPQTLQFIDCGGKKRFLSGGKVAGAYFQIGEKKLAEPIFVAEGCATAATLNKITGKASISAGSANNLEKIVSELKKRHPTKNIILAPDNDKAGQLAAEKIKQNHGIVSISPPREQGVSDWNDYYLKHGVKNTYLTTRAVFNQELGSGKKALAQNRQQAIEGREISRGGI